MNRSPLMMIFPVLLLLLVYGSGFTYISARIYRFLRAVMPTGGSVNPAHVLTGLCVLYVLTIAAGFIPMDKDIQKHFVWFAWVMIGFGLYLLMTFLASDIVLGIARLMKIISMPVSRNVIISVTGAVFAVSVFLTGISIYNAKQLHHTSYSVTVNAHGTSPEPIRAVLIADTHFGYLNDYRWAEKIADGINTQNPDIVFLAGDIFNDNYNAFANPDKALESLLGIETKYGIYAVPGNHDSGATYPDMLDFLKQADITVLQDEHVVIDDNFIVLGRADPSPIGGGAEPRRDLDDVLAEIETGYKDLPVFVVDHQPGAVKEYDNNAAMVLAGHTHKGIMFPANFITGLVYENDYGHMQKTPGSPHVIVTSGAGLWGPPFRLGSINEIVSIDITFTQS